ncbi:Uncharacterized protein QTN25_000133 [Entamoeba marina]
MSHTTEQLLVNQLVRSETINDKKANFVITSLEKHIGYPMLSTFYYDHQTLYILIDVAVLAYNVCDQIKRRKNGILALREPVVEWVTTVLQQTRGTSTALDFVTTSVPLGRLNYLKRHNDERTLRDLLRVADTSINSGAIAPTINYERIQAKVVDCLNRLTWFYRETNAIENKILINIVLEQCSLSMLDGIEEKDLDIIAQFLLRVWVDIRPPAENDLGEVLYNFAIELTDNDEAIAAKITGMVLDYVFRKEMVADIIVDKQAALKLLLDAKELLLSQKK